jgi:threonine dehydrogenase-like Zn-dependent dehydrogenase
MCQNGLYTERGIQGANGYASEYVALEEDFAIALPASLQKTGVLLEPTSVVAKAWEHCEKIGRRARWNPRTVLVTGAGPVGLLAALLGRQRGLEVHVFDRTRDGPKPDLVRSLGATYHDESIDRVPDDFDVIMECTGAAPVISAVLNRSAADGLICLLGVSAPGGVQAFDLGSLNRQVVLDNRVIFGSVNANRRHYEAAIGALAAADQAWLRRLITRQVPLADWATAFVRRDDDIKTVVLFDAAAGLKS